MKIVEKNITELKPYENNPRRNDEAVEGVAQSIKQFGFKVPMVIDREDVIVCGHTRYKAAKKIGMQTVPCVIADDLTEDEIKAFRLADNKVTEKAEWDFELLDIELEDIEIDMSMFDFEIDEDWFTSRKRNDNEGLEDESEEYQEFVEKFEQKKTTDDCYTPDIVYEAVAEFVATEYGKNKDKFVRPFYPGGDYQNEKYADDCIVVDNPPFSILSEIIGWYLEHDISFFMFAPTVSCFATKKHSAFTSIATGSAITYENGAQVNTSFVTNLEDKEIRAKSCPRLYKMIKEANDKNLAEIHNQQRKYKYPDEIVTASMLAKLSKYGQLLEIKHKDCVRISALDSQKEKGDAIYGGGLLLAEKAAAEKAAAEKAAAEKAAAECWGLSDRERDIIKALG